LVLYEQVEMQLNCLVNYTRMEQVSIFSPLNLTAETSEHYHHVWRARWTCSCWKTM